MSLPNEVNPQLLASSASYTINQSLRFRRSASAYLSRTPASAGNRKTFTYSGCIKRGGSFGVDQTIFGCNNGNSNANAFEIFFTTSNTIGIVEWDFYYLSTTQVFRDPAAWYHIVLAVDTTNATANNRIRLYVNGVEVTAFGTRTNPSQNADLALNNTIGHQIGAVNYVSSGGLARYFDGYMAEINFIDGSALTPSSFGQADSQTGVWQPKKYAGTYGTNGFYLNFSDNSAVTAAALGKDSSGNGNNWTPNNISLTAGTTYDWMRDSPTVGALASNYCTLNPVSPLASGSTTTNGNLTFTSGAADVICLGTFGVSSGKWYWEITATTVNASLSAIGIIGQPPASLNVDLRTPSNGYAYISNGNKGNNNTTSAYGATYTSGDVIGVALDMDAGTLVFYKNNSSQGTAYSSLTGTFTPAISDLSGVSSGAVFDCNFGQRPFSYTPPTGFKTLNAFNLPTPTIGATSATQANKYFETVVYSGNSPSSQTITVGFQPDFVWQKSRGQTYNHTLYDAVRGATKEFYSNNTDAETTDSNGLTAFTSNGFTVGSDGELNDPTANHVAWNWNAGGSTVTNTTGSISAQVRANPTSGFSIATFTGNGTGGATVGHGLGVAPSMIMFKGRNTGTSGLVWHIGYGTNQGQQLIDSTAAIYNPGNGLYFNSTYPSSTVVTLGTSGATNGNGQTYVLYSWAAIAGYSAFGKYTGNGSSDGTFVYTGFRPKFIIVKRTDSSDNWMLMDTSINPINVASTHIRPDSSSAELNPGGSPAVSFDFLSNGFKNRESNNQVNNSGGTYIYMAFAESPFKYSLAR